MVLLGSSSPRLLSPAACPRSSIPLRACLPLPLLLVLLTASCTGTAHSQEPQGHRSTNASFRATTSRNLLEGSSSIALLEKHAYYAQGGRRAAGGPRQQQHQGQAGKRKASGLLRGSVIISDFIASLLEPHHPALPTDSWQCNNTRKQRSGPHFRSDPSFESSARIMLLPRDGVADAADQPKHQDGASTVMTACPTGCALVSLVSLVKCVNLLKKYFCSDPKKFASCNPGMSCGASYKTFCKWSKKCSKQENGLESSMDC